ncbi:MAG: Ser-Thr-rich GPI-anchored membrane family protein, partial [Chthoniobacterales bacterium]
ETRSGDSLGGGSDLAAYFGLKANTLVSAVEVTWPSGITQTVTDIAADQRLTLVEQASSTPTPTPTPMPQITVTAPIGKETWTKGNSYSITWSDNLSGKVTIKLLNGRTTAAVIAASTASDGIFVWTVPNSLAEANTYRVEVSSVDSVTIKDQSDRRFAITAGSLGPKR